MKKNSFILLILTLFCTNALAQDIKPYFTIIPDNILGYVNIGLRKNLIDLYNAKQNAEVRNLLGGTTRMAFLSPEYLQLNLSQSTDMEMRMMQAPNDSTGVIVVNKTLKSAYPESTLSFYSTDWKSLLLNSYFTGPVISDFLERDLSAYEMDELNKSIPYSYMRIEIDSSSNKLRVYPEFINSMSKEDRVKTKDWFKEKPLIYYWKEGRYEKE
ncbi:MAG: DUF3256 family protein [Bacteroidales bacterium]